MGQYYHSCCLNDNYQEKPEVKAYCESYDYDNGAKLMEHSYVGNSFVMASMMMLLDNNGSRFVWCGDYAETKVGDYENVYLMISDIADKEIKHIVYKGSTELKVIVNYDKKEFVVIPDMTPEGFVIHPLPLLCADGNGRGGGDYYGTYMKYVGRWAYDHIGIVETPPNGFKQLKINFKEKR